MKVRITSFEESEDDIRLVRDTVFGEEQGVLRELDWDGEDRRCCHVVATDDEGRPIGTGRLHPDGRIGRLAVLKPWRRRGVGGRMLESLVELARREGRGAVYLHAQVPAVAFYLEHGFTEDGSEFVEAGIRHVNMTRITEPPS